MDKLAIPTVKSRFGYHGNCWLHNWLQLLRPSRLTWIAKREAVRLPSRLQFINRLGRPGLRNAKLFGFPPGCSFLDREHNLREILIRHQIHSTNNNFWEWNSNWLLASMIEMIRRWDGAACMIGFTWTVMIVVFVGLGMGLGRPQAIHIHILRACFCSRLSRARLSACRRRSCSLLRSSLSSAVKVGRLVLRDSMGASKLDLWRIWFSTIRKVNTPREGEL